LLESWEIRKECGESEMVVVVVALLTDVGIWMDGFQKEEEQMRGWWWVQQFISCL
jgi:hypothetical protein